MPDVREVQRDIATMTRLLFRLDPDQRAALIGPGGVLRRDQPRREDRL